MIEVAIMLEGQNGLTWARWQRIAEAVEDLGFAGLYRSDHFTNPNGPNIESLECWASLTWLASHTRRIEFGPLVSPVSFRDPIMMTRTALQIDDLSGGRLQYGIGAGWQEREHSMFGYPLLDVSGRMARFAEAVEVVTRLKRGDGPVSFSGQFYTLNEAELVPRPQRPGGPPLVIGGNGPKRTLPLVARYADEWNAVMIPPATFKERAAHLDHLLHENLRQPRDLRRTLMTSTAIGRDDAAVQRKLEGRDAADLRSRGEIVGTPNAVVEQIGAFAEAGVERMMLQWLDLDDLDGIEAVATGVLPQLR